MPSMRLVTRLTPVVAGIAALTVACGSSKSATGTTSPAATTAAAPATTAPTTMAASMPDMPSMSASSDDHGGAATAPVAAAGVTITIKDFDFGAPSGAVKAGSTVTVINEDSVAHTYEDVNGAFDSHTVPPNGGTATFTAPKAGTYQVKCDFHASMHGTLTVS